MHLLYSNEMQVFKQKMSAGLLLFFGLFALIFLTLFAENFHNHSPLEEHDSDCQVFLFTVLHGLENSVAVFVFCLMLVELFYMFPESISVREILQLSIRSQRATPLS